MINSSTNNPLRFNVSWLRSLFPNRHFRASSLLKGIALKSRERIFGQDEENQQDEMRGVVMKINTVQPIAVYPPCRKILRIF